MSAKILTILADGFEESEAVVPVDVLRRLGFEVVLAGLDASVVRGSHGIYINADILLRDVKLSEIKAVFLPGGMPGSLNLRNSDAVIDVVRAIHADGGIVSAICAAPIALGRSGIIKGRRVTAYPGNEDKLDGAIYTGSRTEIDGNIVTGKGPGASFEFAAKLAELLGRKKQALDLFEGMFVKI